MGDLFARTVTDGPLLVAAAVATLVGLISFLSPCVLPLVPGYLSYVTGLAGSDASSGTTAVRTDTRVRMLAGSLLFVLGFTAVFVSYGALFGGLGRALVEHQRAIERVLGLVTIVLGLAFLGLVPGMQREFRIHKLPNAGLIGAPIFGAVFALSWVPCVGPTLGAVLTMASVSGKTDRAVVLAVAYCLGLGLPFVAFGLGFRRLLGVFKAIRRNSQWVTRAGGALLIVVGLALVTGGWQSFLIWLQTTVGVGEVSI